MDNKYISRYAKYNTHFDRTDPFKYGYFDEPSSVFGKLLTGLGLCATFVALMLLPQIVQAFM